MKAREKEREKQRQKKFKSLTRLVFEQKLLSEQRKQSKAKHSLEMDKPNEKNAPKMKKKHSIVVCTMCTNLCVMCGAHR